MLVMKASFLALVAVRVGGATEERRFAMPATAARTRHDRALMLSLGRKPVLATGQRPRHLLVHRLQIPRPGGQPHPADGTRELSQEGRIRIAAQADGPEIDAQAPRLW